MPSASRIARPASTMTARLSGAFAARARLLTGSVGCALFIPLPYRGRTPFDTNRVFNERCLTRTTFVKYIHKRCSSERTPHDLRTDGGSTALIGPPVGHPRRDPR